MNFYKKIASIFLLLVFVISSTPAKELIKLPLLVDHFYDHRNGNNNIGLVSFLAMHYYIEDGSDNDAKEDNQLPFKSAGSVALISFTSLMPPRIIEIATKLRNQNKNSFGIRKDLFLSSQYLAAIWQPPRC